MLVHISQIMGGKERKEMCVVSNLKRMKRCRAELTDAKLRTVDTCTIYTFSADVPVEDETE